MSGGIAPAVVIHFLNDDITNKIENRGTSLAYHLVIVIAPSYEWMHGIVPTVLILGNIFHDVQTRISLRCKSVDVRTALQLADNFLVALSTLYLKNRPFYSAAV
ncbi:hypothetical protein ACS0PU_011462 [Formica fusca]